MYVAKASPFIAPLITQGAIRLSWVRPAMNVWVNRPDFTGDPEVRILGYGKEQMWKQIFT